MKKVLLVAVAAMGLGACTFPKTTKMEPVGETQMQTGSQPAPTSAPASGQSASAAH